MSLACVPAVVAASLTMAVPTATGTPPPATFRPVIGKPVLAPAQPTAGRSLAIVYRVTRSDTGKALLAGTIASSVSAAGKAIPRTDSFRNGVARVVFAVPIAAQGKPVRAALTVTARDGKSANRVDLVRVPLLPKPSVSVGDVSAAEGNSGTTTFSFPITLSIAPVTPVSVAYATADGTATAGSDYTALSGTVAFAPGETSKTVAVLVAGDTVVEPDETFGLTLTSPINATIADGAATGTITNDDVAAPVTAGEYEGITRNGDYVFFTVSGDRTITAFRLNDINEDCTPPGRIEGAIDFGQTTFTIGTDGSFTGESSWTGSEVDGDFELTSETSKVAGHFDTATSVSGIVNLSDEFNYQSKARHYQCSSGDLTWTASLQS